MEETGILKAAAVLPVALFKVNEQAGFKLSLKIAFYQLLFVRIGWYPFSPWPFFISLLLTCKFTILLMSSRKEQESSNTLKLTKFVAVYDLFCHCSLLQHSWNSSWKFIPCCKFCSSIRSGWTLAVFSCYRKTGQDCTRSLLAHSSSLTAQHLHCAQSGMGY